MKKIQLLNFENYLAIIIYYFLPFYYISERYKKIIIDLDNDFLK